MIRRILATIVFLVATVILSVLSIPAALVDRSGRLYCAMARVWSRIFLALFGLRVVVRGAGHLSKSEHYIFAANHSSYTDIPAVFVAIPKDIRLVLRHTLTKIPIWGWSLWASPFLIIDRGNAVKAKRTLNAAVTKIKAGASVLLFPEGTRTHDGTLQAFKRGAFHLAYESGAKVVPVHIHGTFDVLNRFERLPRSNMTITVTIGKPLSVDTSIDGDRNREMDLMQRTEEAVRLHA